MAIWTLEADYDFTTFDFSSDGDKIYFDFLVKNYFEASKLIAQNWRPLNMIRNEPKKHPDFFEIGSSDVIAISKAAVDTLKDSLNDNVELLEIETDAGKYYAMNILNFVDCLNKEESKYEATKGGTIVKYSLLVFDEEKLRENKIFKVPEMPFCTFVTDEIRETCEEKYLRGLFFDTEINLVWYS
ncbi:MAG: DUF1629 domain-containing protein [Ferruginibacter sp.]